MSADLADTDPQETGVPPDAVTATASDGESMVAPVQEVLGQIRRALHDEPVVNGVLARGFAMFEGYPTFRDRFAQRTGVARHVGMEVQEVPGSDEEAVEVVERRIGDYDFCFVHFKAPDARGEDGDFRAKVAAIERIDALMPRLAALEPAVLAVTGDHSTPATYGAHSWHAVPVLLASRWSRPTGTSFGEATCRGGDLGHFEGKHLMSLALAHAGRLVKFGA